MKGRRGRRAGTKAERGPVMGVPGTREELHGGGKIGQVIAKGDEP